jgi:hypothetical protein
LALIISVPSSRHNGGDSSYIVPLWLALIVFNYELNAHASDPMGVGYADIAPIDIV